MRSDSVVGQINRSSDAKANRKRVLMLTHRVPYPLDSGVRIRAHHILEHLSQRFNVSLASVTDEPVTSQQWQVMEEMADTVAVQKITPRWGKLKGFASLAMGGPVTPAYFYRRSLAKIIARWHRIDPFDAVFTTCTGMIDYARVVAKQPGGRRKADTHDLTGKKLVRHVIDLVDVDSAKWQDYAQASSGPMRWVYGAEAKRIKKIESGQADRFNAITVVSAAEAKLYRNHVGDHPGLTVLRHAVDTSYFQPLPDSDNQTLLFVGVLDYKPNEDGITWFVNEVMPKLRAKNPNVTLNIVGRRPTAQVGALGMHPGVNMIGPVDDVRQYMEQATAVIAPLRIARGVQTKVLEAMASGRVAVCSPGAAEGIHANDDEHLIVAQSPQQWVEKLNNVVTNRLLRERVSTAARQRIEKVYPWSRCLEPLESLITGEGLEERVPGLTPLPMAA